MSKCVVFCFNDLIRITLNLLNAFYTEVIIVSISIRQSAYKILKKTLSFFSVQAQSVVKTMA